MSQFKRKQGFVTPFSRKSCATLKHGNEQTKRLPVSKEDSKILSPVHLGRNVQVITPQTRHEIKRRFACGFSQVSTNDTSPGIYVPFELSQASCYSQDSVDVEEKTYHETDGELEMKGPPSKEHLPVCQTKQPSEEDSDVELVQDADAESITTYASTKRANDESEWNQHADHTIEGRDVEHSGDQDVPMPEPFFERKQHQKDGSNIHRENIERMRLNMIDEGLYCSSTTVTKKNVSQSRSVISKAGPSGLIPSTDKRKRKSHKPTGNQERSSKKRVGNRASSILRKLRHGDVRRKKRRSFASMKQEVLKTLKKMHREIQDLLERKKRLCMSVNSSGDEMITGTPRNHTTAKQARNDVVQEE